MDAGLAGLKSRAQSLCDLVVRRPVAVAMVFWGVILLGVISYLQLPVQLLPDITFPTMEVSAFRTGYSVEEMERSVARPLEAILAATPRVAEIRSTARPNYARFVVAFEYGTNMQFAELDVQEKLNRFSRNFDKKVFHTHTFLYSSTGFASMLMWMQMKGPADDDVLYRLAKDYVEPAVSAVDGVAEVSIKGGRRRTVDIVFRPDLLESYGVPVQTVLSRLRSAVAENAYLGSLKSADSDRSIILRCAMETLDDIRQIPLDEKGVVRLGDVATVEARKREPEHLFHYNGANTVGIMVNKESGANPIVVARKIRQSLEGARASLPKGYDVEIEFDVAEEIEEVLGEIKTAAVAGALLAMLVLLVFLRRWRMSLIVFIAIPVSIVATFNLMRLCGMTINLLTLFGLAIGVGILVDNSIVVLENIFRHFERTRNPFAAAGEGAAEVWRALSANTATNLIVFTPILFSEGNVRIVFRELALAVIFPQAMSLVVALGLVPMLTARALLLGARRKESRWARWRARLGQSVRRWRVFWPAYRRLPRRMLRECYGVVLRASLRHRVRVFVFVGLAVMLTYQICLPRIVKDVMKTDTGGGRFRVYVLVPNGSKYEDLERAVTEAEKAIGSLPEVEEMETWGDVEDGATIEIHLKKEKERKRSMDQIRAGILNDIGPLPGALAALERPRESGEREALDFKRGGEIEILGPDDMAIHGNALVLAERLESLPEIARVEAEGETRLTELHFQLDRERAAMLQVSPSDVAQTVGSTRTEGQSSQLFLKEGEQKTEIYVRSSEVRAERHLFEDVERQPVLSRLGQSIPLKDVGRFIASGGERSIERQNLQRIFTLDYFLQPGEKPQKARQAVEEVLKNTPLSGGVIARLGGNVKEAEENFAQVIWMIGLTVVLIYMVMAFIFESLLTPLVIMVTLPLALLGVFWAMALGQLPMDVMSMFGGILLAGIVVNNGIVMLDLVQVLRRERNWRRTRAVMEACYARLRPILMTSLTTTLGVLPMALKQGEEFPWASLGIVIIAGMTTSTILTLIVLPGMLMNAEDATAFVRRIVVWAARLTGRWVVRPGVLSARWAWRGARAGAGSAGRRVLGKVGVDVVDGVDEVAGVDVVDGGDGGKALGGSELGEEARIVMRQVFMTYPVFRMRHLAHVFPSTQYKYGRRPPEGIPALRGVDLELGRGMCGLLGPNGAGKTTLMQILAGILAPTRGYVEVCGHNLALEREQTRRLIGYLPQRFGVPGGFTARQFLDYHALMIGLREPRERRTRIGEALESVNLAREADRRAGAFSTGMKQRLGIARLLLTLPRFLIVDEPTSGLDPIERVKFRNLLARLSAERAVLFSTHIIEDISPNCDRLAVIHRGRVAYLGATSGLVRRIEGAVWEIVAPERERARLAETGHILKSRPRGGEWLFRVLCPFHPHPGAVLAEPTLEDAYMGIILEERELEAGPRMAGILAPAT